MKKPINAEYYKLLGIFTILISLLCGCIVPDNGYLMELNRDGRWREAEQVGLDMLKDKTTFTHGQVSETFFHVIYAKTRMGKKKEAISLIKQYDDWVAREDLPPDILWLPREITRLKDELGLLTPAQHALVKAYGGKRER